jgi:hypothetical protein
VGPTLPVASGREVVRIFEKFGWTMARQSSSHIIFVNSVKWRHFGFLITRKWRAERSRSLIRAANLTVSEFVDRR